MSTIASISASADRASNPSHRIRALPVLVIFPHNQCNCRCMMCDIWRIRESPQLTPADLEQQLNSLRSLGVRWTVFSGGEPQLNEQWSCLAQMLRQIGSRITLLTAGLLLKPQARLVADSVDDVIVSLDGPAAVHNRIRRVDTAFEQVAEGIVALRQLRPDVPVRGRCTVQKANHLHLRAVVQSAKQIGLTSISFLAADLTSTAFNRAEGWAAEKRERIAITREEVDALAVEIEHLIIDYRAEIDSGFVVESNDKLRRIIGHFRAHLDQVDHLAPRCNAPWVSAVIEASGDVRPCFFHPALGNIHEQPLINIVNGPRALEFRATLDVETNPTCKRCVCSLYLPQAHEPQPY